MFIQLFDCAKEVFECYEKEGFNCGFIGYHFKRRVGQLVASIYFAYK